MTKQDRGFSTKDAFKEAVRSWADRLNTEPSQIRVQRMKHKWASCSPRKTLTFSENLLAQPKEFQEYVIVHELLHIRVQNHGKLFRSLMSVYLPDWEDRANRLSTS
ncbi:MAG TPA: M48 family peptidase [Candidatus Acetothermia bacterium]|nr:M48 family peptidase [Candidatus Acetothermia bacterium]